MGNVAHVAGVLRGMRFLWSLVSLSIGITLSAETAPVQPGEEAPVYEMKLVSVFDGPETEFLFVIGDTGFRTVAGLEDFLASRPPGTMLRWSPGCVRQGGEPLLSSEAEMEDFRAFCREHGIDFVLVPSG